MKFRNICIKKKLINATFRYNLKEQLCLLSKYFLTTVGHSFVIFCLENDIGTQNRPKS